MTQAQAYESQQQQQLDAALNAARQQAVVQFGDPSLAQMAGFGIDPQAANFAKQNYLSGNATLARLDKAHTQARQAVINRLAAHGILRSGDLGYQEGEADKSYGNQVYDAQQQIIQYLQGLYQQYLNQRNQLHQSVLQAQQNALASYGNGGY